MLNVSSHHISHHPHSLPSFLTSFSKQTRSNWLGTDRILFLNFLVCSLPLFLKVFLLLIRCIFSRLRPRPAGNKILFAKNVNLVECLGKLFSVFFIIFCFPFHHLIASPEYLHTYRICVPVLVPFVFH